MTLGYAGGPPAYWWPIKDLGDWYCSEGLSCEEGWHIIEHGHPGEADTARRCPCVLKNMEARRRAA